MVKKILIIDDDVDLCRLLSDYLGAEGFRCLCAHDGRLGGEMALESAAGYGLIILDVMLPLKNGFEVLRDIRARDQALPVIMLTAKGEAVDMVVGLEMGADDYLPKPFNPRVLLAKIHTVIRRAGVGGGLPKLVEVALLVQDGFILDEKSYQAEYRGRPLQLTPAEFKIIWLLLSHSGEVVAKDVLFQKALGRREHAFDRSLDMHISRLRKKIWPGSDGAQRLKSIRGEGYLYIPANRRLAG